MDSQSIAYGLGAGIGFTVFGFILLYTVRYIVNTVFDLVRARKLKEDTSES